MHKRIISLLSVGGTVSGVLFAVACGGSSSKTPDASVKLKDSAVPPDAFTCALSSADITTLAGGLSVGGSGAGSGVKFTADVNTTSNLLEVVEVIGFGQFSDPSVGILLVWSDTMGVFSATGAGKFGTPPTAGSHPQDPDAMFGAGFDILNGITDNGNGTVTLNATQGYLLGSGGGTFKITTWTGGAVANGKSNVNAEFQNSSMDGFTFDSSGNGTSDGCTTAVLADFAFPQLEVDWPATIPTGSIRPQVAREHTGLLGLDPEQLKNVPVVPFTKRDAE